MATLATASNLLVQWMMRRSFRSGGQNETTACFAKHSQLGEHGSLETCPWRRLRQKLAGRMGMLEQGPNDG